MRSALNLSRILATSAVIVVISYGALLRLDALTQMYGPARSPYWLQRLQQWRVGDSALRPQAMTWAPVPNYPHADGPPTQYRSDPYTYLKYAREMRSFYAAHVREPLFPFVTKVFLWLFDQQDIAVSLASTAFSIVAIVGTYLVGALAFSPLVGLLGAFTLGIEYELIGWNVGGWRDDAFMAAVVVCTYTMLRYSQQPSRRNALIMGMAAGLACLIRITSLSFVVTGFAFLLLVRGLPWKTRVTHLGLASIVGAALVIPYLVNCWLTFGDPLYSINFHTGAYRATEGQSTEVKQTAGQYIGAHFRASPVRMIDTFIVGMTSYPFTNKWRGFSPWGESVGTWLARASVLGLLLFVGSRSGRLMLVVLAGSMLPYVFTWRVTADWRFTEHTYPFYLLAAGLSIQEIFALLVPSRLRARLAPYQRLKPALTAAAVLVVIGVAVWTITRILPPLILKEALRSGENISITAGDRDAAFFVEGWDHPVREGNVTTRAARASYSALDVPLPDVRDYEMTVRLDPHPRPVDGSTPQLPTIAVFINNQRLSAFAMAWNPQRVGAYDVRVPAGLVKPGMNRLTFMSESGPVFKVWYVRIRPQ